MENSKIDQVYDEFSDLKQQWMDEKRRNKKNVEIPYTGLDKKIREQAEYISNIIRGADLKEVEIALRELLDNKTEEAYTNFYNKVGNKRLIMRYTYQGTDRAYYLNMYTMEKIEYLIKGFLTEEYERSEGGKDYINDFFFGKVENVYLTYVPPYIPKGL